MNVRGMTSACVENRSVCAILQLTFARFNRSVRIRTQRLSTHMVRRHKRPLQSDSSGERLRADRLRMNDARLQNGINALQMC